jgi:hypothetical protein
MTSSRCTLDLANGERLTRDVPHRLEPLDGEARREWHAALAGFQGHRGSPLRDR